MSIQSKVGVSVSELVSFIKEKTVQNVASASNSGLIDLDEKDLNGVIGIVESSIAQAFTTGYYNVEAAIRSIENEMDKKAASSKTKTRSRKK